MSTHFGADDSSLSTRQVGNGNIEAFAVEGTEVDDCGLGEDVCTRSQSQVDVVLALEVDVVYVSKELAFTLEVFVFFAFPFAVLTLAGGVVKEIIFRKVDQMCKLELLNLNYIEHQTQKLPDFNPIIHLHILTPQ